MMWRNPYLRALILALGLWLLWSVLARTTMAWTGFVGAYTLAYLTDPWVAILKRRNAPRWLGVLVAMLVIVGVLRHPLPQRVRADTQLPSHRLVSPLRGVMQPNGFLLELLRVPLTHADTFLLLLHPIGCRPAVRPTGSTLGRKRNRTTWSRPRPGSRAEPCSCS